MNWFTKLFKKLKPAKVNKPLRVCVIVGDNRYQYSSTFQKLRRQHSNVLFMCLPTMALTGCRFDIILSAFKPKTKSERQWYEDLQCRLVPNGIMMNIG